MADSAVRTAIYQMGLDASQYKREADAIDAANKKIVGSTAQVTVAEEKVTAVTRTSADGFAKLEARYDSLIKIEQRRTAAIQQATRFLEEGAITQERYAAQITRVNAHFDRQVASAGAASRGLLAVQAAGNAVNMAMFGLAARLGPVGLALAQLGPLGLAAGAALGVGVGLGGHAIKSAGALGELAEQLGITTTTLQIFQFAAVQSGVKTGELESSLTIFSRTIGDAANGTKTAIDAFNRLGVGVLEAGGKVRSTEDIYKDVSSAIAAIEDPALRASAAQDVFGRGGQRLLPILTKGAEGFNAMAAEAERLGIILSEDAIEKADQAGDALDRLSFRLGQMGLQFGAALAGPLNGFLNWLDESRDKIQAVIDIARYLPSVMMLEFARDQIFGTPSGFTGGPHGSLVGAVTSNVVRTSAPYNPQATSDVESAAKAAAKAREEERKATEAAIQSLDDYIAALVEEHHQLGLSERERFIRNAQLKAEQLATKGNVADVEKYVDAIKKEAAALYDAQKAADDAAEAAKKLADEQKKALEEQKRAAEEQQKLLLEPFKNALEGMQEAFSDFFYDIFSDGLKSTKNFAQSMLEIFKRLASQIAALLVFQPIVSSIIGSLGTGNISQGAGLGNLGGLTGNFNIGEFLFGRGAVPTNGSIGPQQPTSGLLGTGSQALADSFLPVLGSALPGLLSGNLVQAGIGAAGAGIGAALGSIIPGIGTALGAIVGGLLGNLLGGLFGNAPHPFSTTRLLSSNGMFSIGGSKAREGATIEQSSIPTQAAADALNAILTTFDLTAGTLTGKYGITGEGEKSFNYFAHLGDTYKRFAGTQAGATKAIGTLVIETLRDLLTSGQLIGEVGPAFTAVVQQFKGTDIKQFAEKLDLASFYDSLLTGTKTVTEAEKALDLLEKQFAELKTFAEEFGLSLQVVADGLAVAQQKLTDDFNKSVTQQILAFTDPLQAALNELEDAQKKRLEEAKVLGADLVQLERLNQLERQRVIEQVTQQTTDNLIEFYRRITYGDLALASPTTTLTGTRATFEAAAAQAMAGDFNARGNLTGYAEAYLQASQSVNASSPAYFADLARVQDVIGSLIGTVGQMSLTDAVMTGNTEIVRLLAANNNQIHDLIRITQEQSETIDTLTAQLERLLAA